MGHKIIRKKELKCIESHLFYAVKAIMRDNNLKKNDSFIDIEKYDSKSRELCNLLFTAYSLVDEIM